LCLFAFILILFLSLITYFGFKARNKSAKLIAESSKSANSLQNIINDNMTFDSNINLSPNLEEAATNSSVSFLNIDNNNKQNDNENGPV
jgi:hypothetical protein